MLRDVEQVTTEVFLKEAKFLTKTCAESDLSRLLGKRVCGIYSLINKEGVVLYVGKTVCLLSRLKQHLRGYSTPTKQVYDSIHTVCFYPVKRPHNEYKLFSLEEKLIKDLKPVLNGNSQGVEKGYGFKNLREWFNKEIMRTEMITEHVLAGKIAELADEVEYDLVQVNPTTVIDSIPYGIEIIDDNDIFDTQMESFDLTRTKETTKKVEDSPSMIRETIKFIINNFGESVQADKMIDALLSSK